MKRLLLTILFCACLLSCGTRAFAQGAIQLRLPVVVHMMVYDKVKSLSIKVDGEYCIFDKNGKIIAAGSGLKKTKLIARINDFFLSNRMIGEQKLMIKAYAGAHIFLNGSPFSESVQVSINGKGSFSVINMVKLEKYLVGVLAGEIDDETPLEAMKAQAIISRTFAIFSLLKKPESVYQMTTKNPQAYRPILFQKSNYSRAVKETEGIILTFNGCVFPTYFSAVCGGSTEFSGNVWELDFDLPATITCPYCKGSAQYRWDMSLPLDAFRKLLVRNGLKIGTISSLEPKKKSAVSDRVTELIVKHSKGITYVRTNWLRGVIGSDRMRSTSFTAEIEKGKVKFTGRGWGHGVGLCQDGAAKMAAGGKSFQDILSYYYPGTELKRIE